MKCFWIKSLGTNIEYCDMKLILKSRFIYNQFMNKNIITRYKYFHH